jgi:hypothetical protein
MLQAETKVPGGKLVRLRCEVASGRISFAQLSGDFFLTPHDALPKVETFLHGWDLSMPGGEEQLTNRLQKFLARERIDLAGFTPATVAHLVESVRERAGIPMRPDMRGLA